MTGVVGIDVSKVHLDVSAALMRTHFCHCERSVAISSAQQGFSASRRKYRNEIAIRRRRTALLAMTDGGKWVRVISVAAGLSQRFANTAPGIAALLGRLRPQDIAQVVYESAGGYDLPLAAALALSRAAGPWGPSEPGMRLRPNLRPVGQCQPGLSHMDFLTTVIPAKVGIQGRNR